MNVYLIGFMGCGKSTLGKSLSKKVDKFFLDMDAEIEKAQQKSIKSIFEKEGEAAFRDMETEFLKELTGSNFLVSTGGGTPCFFDNMEVMNTNGVTIYIKLPPITLKQRLTNEKSKRPLIAKLSDDELLDFIENRLAERESYYLQSQIIYNPLKETEEDLIQKIKSIL